DFNVSALPRPAGCLRYELATAPRSQQTIFIPDPTDYPDPAIRSSTTSASDHGNAPLGSQRSDAELESRSQRLHAPETTVAIRSCSLPQLPRSQDRTTEEIFHQSKRGIRIFSTLGGSPLRTNSARAWHLRDAAQP